MAIHPLVDKCLVRVADSGYMGSSNATGRESGILEEIPTFDNMLYFGFHSFAFDDSLASEKLSAIHTFYSNLVGKIVYWEALQDKGRRFEADKKEYVLLNLSDIIAFDDAEEATAKMVDDVRSGSFRV